MSEQAHSIWFKADVDGFDTLTDLALNLVSARVAATRPAVDFTPRLIPHNDEAIVPLEAFQILWQRRSR